MVAMAGVVVFAGTIVTSTGPHGGDEEAKRFELDISSVARVHGISVMIFLTLVLVLFGMLRRTRAPEAVQTRLGAVLLIACIQAAIGYIQYFNDIPAALVALHVAGATALWSAVIWYYLGLFHRDAEATDGAPTPAAAGSGELLPA